MDEEGNEKSNIFLTHTQSLGTRQPQYSNRGFLANGNLVQGIMPNSKTVLHELIAAVLGGLLLNFRIRGCPKWKHS